MVRSGNIMSIYFMCCLLLAQACTTFAFGAVRRSPLCFVAHRSNGSFRKRQLDSAMSITPQLTTVKMRAKKGKGVEVAPGGEDDMNNNNQDICFALDTGDATVMQNFMVKFAIDRNNVISIDEFKEAVLQKFSSYALKDMDASCLLVYSGLDNTTMLDGIAPWNVETDGGDPSHPLIVKVTRRSNTFKQDGTFNSCSE
jgi:hypothetical protein